MFKIKSNKEIATKANQLVEVFKKQYQPSNIKIDIFLNQAQQALKERQIAPQVIMEKFVKGVYDVFLKEKITIGNEAFKTLKAMEELARQRSWWPFKKYDPWN